MGGCESFTAAEIVAEFLIFVVLLALNILAVSAALDDSVEKGFGDTDEIFLLYFCPVLIPFVSVPFVGDRSVDDCMVMNFDVVVFFAEIVIGDLCDTTGFVV